MYSEIFDAIESFSFKEKEVPFPSEILEMPKEIRKIPSYYYLNWGKVFLVANHKGFWKDAFSISLFYDPSIFLSNFFHSFYYFVTLCTFIKISKLF
jgi:hypothetical protein